MARLHTYPAEPLTLTFIADLYSFHMMDCFLNIPQDFFQVVSLMLMYVKARLALKCKTAVCIIWPYVQNKSLFSLNTIKW